VALLDEARRETGTAAECLLSLVRGDDSEDDWVRGIVGACLIADIRAELSAIRRALTNAR
jgi:hypothetical protein